MELLHGRIRHFGIQSGDIIELFSGQTELGTGTLAKVTEVAPENRSIHVDHSCGPIKDMALIKNVYRSIPFGPEKS